MSLAEVASFDDRGPGLDRTPPQDIAAEQSVLGAMLTSKDAIADVVEIIKGRDFYRPAHEQIYEAIIELYGKGEPADAITVAAELAKRGEIGRVGGHVYLHDLLASISVAANAAYYAEIVKEKAVLRRLVEASVKIAQMGYQAQGDVGDIVDSAQQALYEVTEGKTSEDYQPLSSLLESTLDEIEAIGSRGGQMAGVPTGFIELDELTNGLHSGQMIIVAARPAMGKALALDTALPTPTGWTTMGDVQVGDQLIGADGRPTRVVAATDVMTDRPCYRITFSDGTQVVADAEHQWRATSRAGRRAEAERKAPRTYLPSPSVQRLQALADAADGASTMATFRELLEEVGTVFQHVLHVVLRDVGSQGRALRPASGESRSYAWHAPVYDRARALRALADRCAAPVGSRVRVAHSPIVTTEQMAETVTLADGRANWAVELASPVELPERQLLVPPYTLGVWLGDGHSRSARFTSADSQIADEVRADGLVVTARGLLHTMQLSRTPVEVRKCVVCGSGFVPRQADVRTCGRVCGGKSRGILKPAPSACPDCGKPYSGGQQCARCRAAVGSVQARLRTLGVLGNKHIPSAYLRASRTQRWALLEGLMDTDGTVTRTGSLQLVLTDAALARDASELIMSLGIRCQTATKKVRGRDEAHSIAYVLTFSADDSPFRLTRTREAQPARPGHGRTTGRRYIKSFVPIQSVPVRCVEVDNADHMYLATEAMVPTHNSTLGLDFARAASIKNGLCSAFFSLEMSKSEIVMRLLSAEAQIPLNHIRKGQMTDEDWARMSRKMGQISEAPLYIDDSPNLTMMEIRAKARRLKQRHDLKLVIIDYMQLMTSGKRVESRQLEVSEFSRQIKLLAKELELPVVALSQLNRGPEQRQGGTPMLSDLRESGSLEQDADMVILLHRDDVYNRDSARQGEADFIVAKHRNGPTKTLTTAFQGHYSRFVDMQH